ncbi:MAG: hypothetical protein I8H72_00270 [Myxococcaceae bacterium]|nr:hypothetical protein [Myxococcaceae bacterium]
MAILTGDESVFKTLYQRYSDSSSLTMPSEEGLSLADFASLAGTYFVGRKLRSLELGLSTT